MLAETGCGIHRIAPHVVEELATGHDTGDHGADMQPGPDLPAGFRSGRGRDLETASRRPQNRIGDLM